MGILGKEGCRYARDWAVKIYMFGNSTTTVGEQLTHEEAERIYNELKKEIESGKPFIEVVTDGHGNSEDTECIQTNLIQSIRIWRK